MSRRVVVSIDGGGIRGVLPLILLKEIQHRLSVDLFQAVSSWWGTSTGALISGALVIQSQSKFEVAVQNVLDLYEFRSSNAIQPGGASIPTRALDQMIIANFGDLSLNDFPQLNIVAATEAPHEVVVFNGRNSCKVADAIRASCAFPGLFPPVEINGQLYVDGFLCAKNPAKLALQGALDQDQQKTILLSLGTGVMRATDPIEESVEMVDAELRDYANTHDLDYFRFNPVLKYAGDSMQNTSPKNIFNLRKDAMAFITENESEIDALVASVGAI